MSKKSDEKKSKNKARDDIILSSPTNFQQGIHISADNMGTLVTV